MEVLKAVKEGVVENFKVIESSKNHHAIVDRYGEVLGYRYPIKPELLETLKNSTSNLPHKRRRAGVRGSYLT